MGLNNGYSKTYPKKCIESNRCVPNQKKRVKNKSATNIDLPSYEEFKKEYLVTTNFFGIGCAIASLIATPFELHWRIILSICFLFSSIKRIKRSK